MNTEDIGVEIMETVNNTSDLSGAIKRLESKRRLMEQDLQDQFHEILDGLKPTNILKNTLREVQESSALKHNLLKVALGLGVGYFSRKLVVGKSAGLVKKALGTALQFGITQFIAKKDDSEQPNRSEKKNIFKRILSI
ncbi:MAG: hypothetical protein ABI184_07835 [Ginsengibacter sp.]